MTDGTATTSEAPTTRKADVQTGFVPSVTASHDANLTTSFAGVVNAQGDANLNQGAAGAVVAQGDVSVTQAGAAAIVGRAITGENIGGAVLVGSEVSVKNAWVGVALSPNLEVSEDSRVIIGTKAAIIIAVAMFGIFGIAAVLAVLGARRAMAWRPNLPMPSIQWRRS